MTQEQGTGTPSSPIEAESFGQQDDHGTARRMLRGLVQIISLAILYNLWLILSCALWHGEFFRLVREVYLFDTVMFPPVLVFYGVGSWWWLHRRGERRGRALALLAAAGGLMLLAVHGWATHVEPRLLRVRHERLVVEGLTRPLRILHISDIQSGGIGRYEEKAFARMRELRPDLVVLTGDLLQPVPPHDVQEDWPKLRAMMESLEAPLGKFVVQGDVDHPVLGALMAGEGGFRLLMDSSEEIDLPEGGRLRILGLSVGMSADAGMAGVARALVQEWLAEGDDDAVTVILGHRPDYVLGVRDLPITLCVAGHTHGGQIRLPFLGPILTLSRVPRKWALGMHEIGATWVNVGGARFRGAKYPHQLPGNVGY